MMTPEECMPDGEKVDWGKGPPPVSPALACTMNLTMQFFIVYLAYEIFKVAYGFIKTNPIGLLYKDKLELVQTTLRLTTDTVKFAPMLCILFIAARMRALQIDPEHGAPQRWAQHCFYACTYAVMLQSLLTLLTMIPALGMKVV